MRLSAHARFARGRTECAPTDDFAPRITHPGDATCRNLRYG